MRAVRATTWRIAVGLLLIGSFACRRSGAQATLQVINRPAAVSLGVGDTITVYAVVTVTESAAPATVGWSSDNDAIAHVDRNGHVTARAPGVTGITSRIGTAFASTRVSVTARAPNGEERTLASRAPAPAAIAKPAPAAAPLPPAKLQAAPRLQQAETAPAPSRVPGTRAPPLPFKGNPHSPHFSHISVFYTDFYGSYASPADQRVVYPFLGKRLDGVMSGPRSQWKAVDPTIRHFRYALQFSVPVPGQKSTPDDIASSYYADMQRWYAAHPQYDIEKAFLHRGGHDAAHRVQVKIWDSMRYGINPGDPGQRAYQIDRLSRVAQGEDGIFLDEFGGPMSGIPKGVDEFPTMASYMTAETQLIAQVHDAIKPRILLINIAEYWNPADSALVVAGGGTHLERTNFPFSDRLVGRWSVIDNLLAMNVYTEFVTLWGYTDWLTSTSFPSFGPGMYASKLERGQLVQLASYYMVVPADPQRLSFDQQNLWNVRPDTVWMPAVEVDVGHPREARHVIASGKDAAVQPYKIYARDFDHAYVVMRPQLDWRKQTYADSTGVVVPLPAPMRPLHRDGSLGAAVSSVTLRNVEAAILFK
ncbi:MAG: Ig-like domain-containing protein [Gemmatimonadaceae bacterium]|nr:Ig-like domain-containing protein [Gemmatimonadaceae bacterium]